MNYYTGVDTSKSFTEALNSKKNEMWGSCNQYLEISTYYRQVKEYFDVFPKEQIKILVYEDWTKNLQIEINSLLDFLNVKNYDSNFNDQVDRNKIKPLKKIFVLNFLRHNKIKSIIKKLLNQDRVDNLKSYLFSDNKEIEKLDPKLREELSLKFKNDIEMLNELTQIDFNKKWN